MNFIEVLILGIIEGFTEFLPISSTGHLIIASHVMGLSDSSFVKSFNIVIQFGAILSVLVIYWRNFLPDLNFYKKLFFAFLPAAIIGLLIKDKIDALLGSVTVVAYALIVGGIALIYMDYFLKDKSHDKTIKDINTKNALMVGFMQCLAFIPGVSRSAATILGGLLLKLDKKSAAEYSFFLAVPTLTAAGSLKLLKVIPTIDSSQILFLLLGTVISFIVALASIQFFIKLVSKIGFTPFGIYRIILGIAILILL